MAEVTCFCYHPSESVLHAIDARFKMACLIMMSLCIVNSGAWALAVLTAAFVALSRAARLPVIRLAGELRFFGLFLGFVFIARALSFPAPSDVTIMKVGISFPGLRDAGLVSWRLLLIVLCGFMFIAATKSSEIKRAIEWYCRPFPFIPGKRIATMIGLIVRFLPVIFQQIRETSDAQRARCIEQRKNPASRVIRLVVPLIRRTFETADKLAVAMEARCYNEDRTAAGSFAAAPRDWLALMTVVGLCAVCLFRH